MSVPANIVVVIRLQTLILIALSSGCQDASVIILHSLKQDALHMCALLTLIIEKVAQLSAASDPVSSLNVKTAISSLLYLL